MEKQPQINPQEKSKTDSSYFPPFTIDPNERTITFHEEPNPVRYRFPETASIDDIMRYVSIRSHRGYEVTRLYTPGQLESTSNASSSKVLTKREEEVAFLLEQGLTNKEIARKLNISEQTVKNHISSAFRKT